MLTSEARRKDITERLSMLTTYIRLNNKQGLTDANKAAEDFFCGLLNMVLDASLGNMNRIQQDYPAIDLGDPVEALAVQVTSTNNHAKIQHTLDEFFGNELEQTYNQLMVLIIGEKLKYRKPFKTKRRFHFDADRDVWDTAKLCNEIMELSNEKQEAVIRYLDAKMDLPKLFPDIPEEEPAPAPAAVSLTPLVFLEKKLKYKLPTFVGFVGRDREIAELHEKLVEQNKKLIFITGLGGMGKTELAVEFGQRLKDHKVHFAHFAGSFRQTVSQNIALDIENLRRDEKRPEEEIYRDAMGVLEECGEDTVLIIDNADPPDERNFDLLRDKTFEDLCAMKLRLVITTRATVPGGVRVDKMTDADMNKLMRQHKPDLSDEDADALIEVVEGHTMTLDLMARAMVGGWSPLTPGKLLKALRRNDLAASVSKAVSSDYNRAQQRIDEHLRTVFKLSGIPENAKQVMRCAALLPEAGMNADLFAGALPQDAQAALDALADRAWLRVKDGVATIHPVVRLICFEELKPTDETCGAFLENLWTQYADTKYNTTQYTQMAELFSSATEKLADANGDWADHGRKLWHVVGQTEKALALCEKVLAIREKVFPPNDPKLATAYNDLGHIHSDLGHLHRSLELLQKALDIRKEVLDENDPDLAMSYNNVGCAYDELGEYNKALEYQERALVLRQRALPADHSDLAMSYNNVGKIYNDLGKHSKALEYQERALAIWKKVLPTDHPDLAKCYNNVATTWFCLGNRKRALEYMAEALRIMEKSLPPKHPDIKKVKDNMKAMKQLGSMPKWAFRK